jgi:hypothetical protein
MIYDLGFMILVETAFIPHPKSKSQEPRIKTQDQNRTTAVPPTPHIPHPKSKIPNWVILACLRFIQKKSCTFVLPLQELFR